MAATPSPCFRIAPRCCSSSTSWILQNGHQSAERKNTSMAPFGPMTDLRALVTAILVRRRKSRHLLANVGPGLDVLAIQRRDRKHPDRHCGKKSFCHISSWSTQNVNVSSSAIMMTGGPPDDIFTAWANVSLPPADSAHCWSASMDGK